MEQVAVPLPPPAPSQPRRWWFAGVALLGVLIVVGGALVATKIFAATRSTFADSMPPQSSAFVHIDLLNVLRSGELDRMLAAFETENELGHPVDDAVAEIDRLLLEEAKFDLSNDIIPWIGRGVGVSVTNFSLAGLEPEFIAAIDVRDSGEFNKFLPKLQATIEETEGPMFESEYRGVTIYTSDDGAFALSKAVFLIGSNNLAVEDAIDAQEGESLADSPEFAATLDLLPEDRVFTAWVDMTGYVNELAGFGGIPDTEGIEPALIDEAALPTSYGFSGRFVDAGLRFDFAAIYPEESEFFNPWQDTQLETAELAPDSTLGFLAVPPFVKAWVDTFQNSVPEVFTDTERQAAEQFGIDLQADFLDLLDGEFGLVVTREDGGFLDREYEIPVGVAAFLGTSEQDRLRNTLARALDIIVDEFSDQSIRGPLGDPELYDLTDEYLETAFPFGVDYGYLMGATDRSLLEDMFAGDGNTLANDSTYMAVAAELDDMEHVFYADFIKIFDLIKTMDPDDTPEFPAALESMLGGFRVDGNVQYGAFVVAIDY